MAPDAMAPFRGRGLALVFVLLAMLGGGGRQGKGKRGNGGEAYQSFLCVELLPVGLRNFGSLIAGLQSPLHKFL